MYGWQLFAAYNLFAPPPPEDPGSAPATESKISAQRLINFHNTIVILSILLLRCGGVYITV